MTHFAPNPAVQPAAFACFDKWALFDALRDARETFGLKDRSLTVLRALLSFHPARDIAIDQPTIVFPSNATLASRCDGMPESTLRRHITHLIACGLIARHDSPTRKRYAHRLGANQLDAYGFDLSPLAAQASDIADAAAAAREKSARTAALRDRLRMLLIERAESLTPEDTATFTRLLRRKDAIAALATAISTLESTPEITAEPASPASLSSAADSHFGRHNLESNSPLESNKIADIPTSQPILLRTDPTPHEAAPTITPTAIMQRYPQINDYATEPLESWESLFAFGPRLAAMLGINDSLWQRMKSIMGATGAVLTTAFILSRFESLRSPAAYANALCSKHLTGRFQPDALLIKS